MAAAKLSCHQLADRFISNKAIDLVDKACAKIKNELTSRPTASVGDYQAIQLTDLFVYVHGPSVGRLVSGANRVEFEPMG